MELQHQVPAPLNGGLTSQKRYFRGTTYGICGTLPAAALSISLTQAFIGVTAITFIYEWLRDRATLSWSLRSSAAPELLAGGALFAWFIISLGLQLVLGPDAGLTFRRAAARELSDLPLYGFAWVVLIASAEPGNRSLILKALTAYAALLVASGVAALFSEFRLAKLVMGAGEIASAKNRPQHLVYSFGDLRIFRPIGFMNTRLTFAGMLVMMVPFALTRFAAKEPVHRARWFWSALFLGLLAVLFVNGTRSAWIGLGAVALACGAVMAARRLSRRWLVAFGIAPLALATGMTVAPPELRGALADSISSRVIRYTDAERPILWAAALDLLTQRPLTGVGPGAFPESQSSWRASFVAANPMTLYWVTNAPDGHAHSDLLHVAATGGIPAGVAFLTLMFFVLRRAFDETLPPMARALALGGAGLFPAGLFQCYFQDDEVVTVFWIIVALAGSFSQQPLNSANDESTTSESKRLRSAP